MQRKCAACALMLCLSVALPAVAADPAVSVHQYAKATWTEQEGLPSAFIWAITQDDAGYLWLGTGAGLIRFDGMRFLHIEELSTTPVRVLVAARDKSLWIGMETGFGVVRMQRGQFIRYTDSLPASINALLEDSNGTVWAGGRGGLSWFENGRWQTLEGAALNDAAVIGLYEDRDRTLWVATPGRLYQRAIGATAFTPVSSAFPVRALVEDRDGTMWGVGVQQAIGTVVESPANGQLSAWRDINAWRVLRDRQGDFWVATLGHGVLRVSHPDADTAPRVEPVRTEGTLSSAVVRSLFEDREGNIWVGTQSGLTRLSDNIVKTIADAPEQGQSIRSVTADRHGVIWVGTDNGIDQYSGTNRRHYGRDEGLPTLVTNSIHVDRHGVIWAATDRGGLSRFADGRFVPVIVPGESPLQRVWAMTGDDDGALWLCEVDRGVFRWQAGTLTSYQHVPEIGRKSGTVAFTDHLGRVWIGFTDGSLAVHEQGRFRVYGPADGLPGGRVGAIHEDSHQTLWVGTASGLSRWTNGAFATVNAGQQLPLTNVRAIVEDLDHHIWVGTSAGLLRFDSDSTRVSLFDASDGLRGAPMSIGGWPTAAVSADGSLWFATSSGIALLDPRRLQRNWLPPPVLIERIIADGEEYGLTPNLRLPALTSRIQFDYTGLSFAAPAKVRFKFRLEGFDRDWIDGGTRRQAVYTNLSPGAYQFRVIADNHGVWNETGASWAFSIRPTFYQTKSFYAAGLTLAALAAFGAWRHRARQVQQRFSLVLTERARVAREIHDTLLQSMVGVAFQFDAVAMEVEELGQAPSRRLNRLRRQIEVAIAEARESIWDLRSPAPGHDFTAALHEIAQGLDSRNVGVEIHLKGTPRPVPRRVEEAFLRIAREAVSNAVRHGHATHVQLELSYDAAAISLRVVDDGCGFDADAPLQLGGHWGLATMRERAEHLGGYLNVVSRPGRGTEILTVAPLSAAGVSR